MSERNSPPEIPECSTHVDAAGIIHLQHKGTGRTAEAHSEQEAVQQGMLLRILAAYRRPESEIPFTTGDMP
ncbi:hypothetical protein FHU36_000280 [Nonomuraea muscovyensis]|uniref:Uncharacterized protein n=1 Tax=Nonomuraea muscovyensis TaxID=1124761 RepID=A0A7X0BX60_9ACTN|nr:hypothetical protein [Nonomuraea muscovyensis]MBB6343771.1 hypothetical protein [Nonomuraea muscovyensis]